MYLYSFAYLKLSCKDVAFNRDQLYIEAITACSKAVSLRCKLVRREKAVEMRNDFLTKELSKLEKITETDILKNKEPHLWI